jgi:hypothetical protein
MPTPIVVSIDPSRVQVQPGEQGSAAITIRNRSEEVAHYLLSLEGVTPDWAAIVPDQVSAFPLQETHARLVIHPPAGTRGATYHLTVRAVSQENAALQGQGPIDVDVPAPVQPIPGPPPATPEPPAATQKPQAAAQIEIRAEPLKESKLPPPATQWRLALRNASTVLDTFSFNIAGLRPNWVNVEPAALTLKPGEEGNAILTIRPGDDTPAGAYPFKLRAFSHLNVNQRTELVLQVAVQPRVGFKLSLFPRDAESQGGREFKVSLISDAASNTDLWLDLSAGDQDNACDYALEPSRVFLPARQTVATGLRVQPRTVLAPNERKTYTITVVATPRASAVSPQTDEARLTQIGAATMSLALKPQVQNAELEAEYMLKAMNPSTVQTNLIFSGEDPEDACDYIFQPSTLILPPRGESQVQLKVKARAFFEGAGQRQIPFTIAATRTGELVAAVKVDGKFVQQQLRSIPLELIPPQQSQPGRARYFVKTRNPRATPIQIWLDAKDESDALAFSLNPNVIRLSAGAEGSATIVAQPKDKLAPGEQRRVHKFTVTGTVDGTGTAVATNGILAQTRGIDWPSLFGGGLRVGIWLGRWLVALGILGFLGTLALGGVDRIAGCSPALGRLLHAIPFLSPDLVRNLLNLSPFYGLAQPIVYLLEGIVNVLFQVKCS